MKIYQFLVLLLVSLIINSCGGISKEEQMCIPKELTLNKLIFSENISHYFGPYGINPGLHVYEYKLENYFIDNITMNNSITFNAYQFKKFKSHATNPPTYRKTWFTFNKWENTPILKNSQFGRYVQKNHNEIKNEYATLSDFYGSKNKVLELGIPADIERKINKALKSNTSLYSFGGYRNSCVLLLYPEEKLAFYLDQK